ncbi:hypothetical protein [Paracoccus indicus]|uniref:hypothetical protein n=1 Tax=Paracoccus indicus TaxID=2079229 RepID=UPI000D3A4D85|nr:hypothetical protein [Paracoccus indicus]
MARPRRKPAPVPALRLSRKRRSNRSSRAQITPPPTDAARLRAEIGTTVRSIREMIDADASVFSAADVPAAVIAPQAPRSPKLIRIWQAFRAPVQVQPQPIVAAQPDPMIDAAFALQEPVPLPPPTAQDVAQIVMEHPALQHHLHDAVQQQLEGEMGQRFSANLRAVIRAQVAMAVEDQMAAI